ncbi:VCBS repeat-containing protein [Streptomyces gardneri]|uniref:FG-GAP repeat domain-containing protein n=1 Tax=Streptomyces gardneri TaxID=66892 RepID=UPI0012662F40|nr:VCBS repeat-containing protein [Streptomyces gardneri]QPK47219.1 VCBS repeat-containing protein [Streptomyces gardneri]WRK38642.1 VCBS repeat-containing protein [Streptomyces venezuelae]
MSKRMRRAAAMSGVAGLLAVAGVTAGAGVAAAEDLKLSGYDAVAGPGSMPRFYPLVESGSGLGGKMVITVGTKPMTDPAGAGAGFPKGYVTFPNSCPRLAGYTGVFVCDWPLVAVPDARVPMNATDTTLYWGFAYTSRNGDLAAAVREARSAAALPSAGHRGTGKVTVKSAASAALNTVAFDLPSVPKNGTVRQQLRVHAADTGRLALRFRLDEGQLAAGQTLVRLGKPTFGAGAKCTVPDPHLTWGAGANLLCELEPGDHVISYELSNAPGQYAQKYRAFTEYDLYSNTPTPPEANVRQWSAAFAVQGLPVKPWHGLHARDTDGRLWGYDGTRKADEPFRSRDEVGTGWGTYTALTSLSPYRQGPWHFGDVKPSAATRGLGDIVGRDATGTLWYHDRQLDWDRPFAPRVKVGTGWNIYDRIDGAGDVDRDGRVDLLARDKAGVLWLYKGTGSFTSARFKAPVRIGAGWGAYNQLAGGADVTGDGRADLLARDKAGVLWLYKGTGSGTTPYTGRTRVGAGWGGYDQLVVAGDLTDDGKADAVARDRSGVLWLYKGTGGATTPFAACTRIGSGWNAYNRVF